MSLTAKQGFEPPTLDSVVVVVVVGLHKSTQGHAKFRLRSQMSRKAPFRRHTQLWFVPTSSPPSFKKEVTRAPSILPEDTQASAEAHGQPAEAKALFPLHVGECKSEVLDLGSLFNPVWGMAPEVGWENTMKQINNKDVFNGLETSTFMQGLKCAVSDASRGGL